MRGSNRITELIRKGKVAMGTFVFLPEPAIVEMIGNSGFDFVILDMEHAALSVREVETLIRSAELSGMDSLVRISKERSEDILRVLEAGATGVMVPHVRRAADLAQVIEAVKYPPVGRRGSCRGVRAARYGDTDFARYTLEANTRSWVIALVEDMEGCAQIGEIISVPGLSAVSPGPGDLATALGVPGQTDHPQVIEVVEKILDAARRREIPFAMYVTETRASSKWMRKGANMIIHSIDTRIIMEAYRGALRQLREEAGQ